MTSPAASTPARARLVLAVALVIAVAAGGLAGVALHKLSQARHAGSHPSQGSAAAAAAAKTVMADGGQYAVDFTSFDYRTLARDRASTATHFTPAYAKAYLVQSKALGPGIRKAKAVAVSQVVATGLRAFNPSAGSATVLVALNITTKNIKSPDGSLSYYRFSVPLQRRGDQWFASNMVPV
jgi:hypothetical protein